MAQVLVFRSGLVNDLNYLSKTMFRLLFGRKLCNRKRRVCLLFVVLSISLLIYQSLCRGHQFQLSGYYTSGLHLTDLSTFSLTPNLSYCQMDHGGNLSYYVIVKSEPGQFHQRNLARKTWARTIRDRVIFVIGLSSKYNVDNLVEMESQREKDILRIRHLDSYYDLTLKVVASLRWTLEHCGRMKFYICMDIDTILFKRTLKNYLSSKMNDSRTVYGHGVIPFRFINYYNSYGFYKWYVPQESYVFKKFATYTPGFLYILTGDSLQLLMQAHDKLKKTNKYFFIDDVYITGLLRDVAGVKIVSDQKLYYASILPGRNKFSRHPLIAFGELNNVKTYTQVWKRLGNKF